MENSDSRIATFEHKQRVAYYMGLVIKELIERANNHDNPKLSSPEVELFNECTPNLKDTTYDSPEYRETLATKLRPALDHHFAKCRHHPEHFPNGVKDMNLVDIVEMFCDWKAASERQLNGNILKSIATNQDKFGYSRDLGSIMENTANWFEET